MPKMTDSRQIVEFPVPVYEHALKGMREHLEAIDGVAVDDYTKASTAVEEGLGIDHQHGPDGL